MLLSNAVEVMVITILVVVQAVSLPQPLPPLPIVTNQMILQKIQHLSFYLFLKTVRESESGAAIFATTGEYSQVENMIGK